MASARGARGERTAPESHLAGDRRFARGEWFDPDNIESRNDLQRWLVAARWPATRSHLRAVAQDDGAPAEVIALLDRLPAEGEFAVFADVWRAVGGRVEEGRM